MASQRQIDANRRNAQRSTGPKTQAGRERSRLNALKHGLSRKLPTPASASPLILPLTQATAGEGGHDPEVLARAEHIAVESLTFSPSVTSALNTWRKPQTHALRPRSPSRA